MLNNKHLPNLLINPPKGFQEVFSKGHRFQLTSVLLRLGSAESRVPFYRLEEARSLLNLHEVEAPFVGKCNLFMQVLCDRIK
jgi:hypothetical protein